IGGRYAFLNRQLGDENLGRFVGSLGAMAPWYYLKPILLTAAPRSILTPVAAIYALRNHGLSRSSPSEEDSPLLPGEVGASPQAPGEGASAAPISDSNSTRTRPSVRLFAIFYFTTVIFFTLAAYKRRSYLLPV